MAPVKQAYQYPSTELPTGHIRLLCQHSDQSVSTDLGLKLAHYTLQTVKLSHSHKHLPSHDHTSPTLSYTAISYVWGPDQKAPFTIAIDYQLFSVGLYLFAALCHLQKNFSLPYWVDAICINQKDEAEKGRQVAQMGDVYRYAKRVLVWLGPGDSKYANAIAQIDKIGAAALRERVEDLTTAHLKQWPDFGADAVLNGIKNSLEKVMEDSFCQGKFPVGSFLDLMDNVWFERAWVVQELSVPHNNLVTFVAGFDYLPYEHLAAGYKLFLIWYAGPLREIKAEPTWPSLWSEIFTFWKSVRNLPRPPNARAGITLGFRKKYWKKEERMTWKELLTLSYAQDSTIDLQCKFPEDKIYALAGMTRDIAFLGEASTFYDRQNQSLKVRELYTNVARHLISKGDLDILSLCRAPAERDSDSVAMNSSAPKLPSEQDHVLPSWVPDWWKPMRPPWGLYKEDEISQANREELINISTLFPEQYILRVQGWHIGTIRKRGPVWKASLESFDWVAAKILLDNVEGYLKESSLYDGKQRDDAKWRIPIGNKEQNALMQTIPATPDSQDAFEEMKKEVSSWKPGSRMYGAKFTSYMNMMWSMYESRPFMTDTGHVGLCPATARDGDKMYCISGSHVPYVFYEPKPGKFVLVGEAYVEGIKDGKFRGMAGAKTWLEVV